MNPNPRPTLPPELEAFRTELATFYKELPQLLREGQEGKHVVLKGSTSHGVWDTFHDARQYGYLKFEDGSFLSQKIDDRFLSLLEPIFGTAPSEPPASAPPKPSTPVSVAEVA